MCGTPLPEALFSSYSTKIITTFTRTIRFMYVNTDLSASFMRTLSVTPASWEVPFSSYDTHPWHRLRFQVTAPRPSPLSPPPPDLSDSCMQTPLLVDFGVDIVTKVRGTSVYRASYDSLTRLDGRLTPTFWWLWTFRDQIVIQGEFMGFCVVLLLLEGNFYGRSQWHSSARDF